MLNITNYQRNANQNYNEVPPHTTLNGHHQKKKFTTNKCRRGCGEKGTLLYCWWECKLVQPVWKTVWRFLKKLKIELPYVPAIPLLGIYLERTIIWKYTCTLMFIAAIFIIAKTWKQPKCPLTNEWIKKMSYIYIYIYIYIYTHIYACYITYTLTHSGIPLSHKKRIKSCHLQQHGWT